SAYWGGQESSCGLTLRLPSERTSAEPNDFRPQVVHDLLDRAVARRVAAVSAGHLSSCASFLHACWQVLIYRLTGQTPVVIGTAFDYRDDEELKSAVGLLAKYLPVGCRLADDLPFSRHRELADHALREAGRWQECFRWADLYQPEAGDEQRPFLPVSFDYSDSPAPRVASGLSLSLYKGYACMDRFKLKLSCRTAGDGISTDLHYDSSLFSAATAERLLQRFHRLVRSVIEEPHAAIGVLEVIPDAERRRLLVELNATRTDRTIGGRVNELFEDPVTRTPDSVAAAFEAERLTYSELNARANRLAHYLRELAVG